MSRPFNKTDANSSNAVVHIDPVKSAIYIGRINLDTGYSINVPQCMHDEFEDAPPFLHLGQL
jgi:hypothetical protein